MNDTPQPERDKKIAIWIAIAAIAVGIVAYMLWQPATDPEPTPEPTPTTEDPTDPTPTPTPTPDDENDEDANIRITSPLPNDIISLPAVIEGQARVFESTIQLRLRDGDGSILVERFTMTDAPDVGQFGSYRIELFYPEPQSPTGTLEAFQESAEDGSEIDLVSIPVRFQSVDALTVNTYYSNSQEDPDMLECDVTYPAERRIPHTAAVARASLEQLLLGPSNDEARQGFHTSLPMGTTIRNITIEDGTAHVDFSEELRMVAGSCAVQAARSQIESTLTQFPTVNEVEISIDGSTEDILEP